MTGVATATLTSSLPVQLTRFVGRSHELDDLAVLLATTRLLTLTGAGGSGKTRLARKAAERALEWHDQSTWIDLAAEGLSLTAIEAIELALADVAPRTAEYRVPAAMATAIPFETAPDSNAPQLRVQALGPLQVFRDAVPIDAATWGSARPRELLAFLLMHPGGCTKEQAGLAFWPEASSAQLRNSFHVTLHRLRKALGHPEWITLSNDRYRVDPSVLVEFDVTRFEQEATAALRALKRGDGDAAAALETALERYRGDFLDGEPAGDWHLAHRDHLQRLYIDGLLAVGNALVKAERLPRAAEAFRRVLARDELHEEAWRRLMLCHAGMGERAQAMRLYQRLTELLKRELDAEPDDETTELFERLQRGTGS